MAQTRVSEICGICKKKINQGSAIYITKVNLVEYGRGGPGDGGMSFGGAYRKNPKGKMRIQYLGTSKPRLCLHIECYLEKIASLIV